MVETFRTWAASWGADIPLGSCEYSHLNAVLLKEQAKQMLAQWGSPPNQGVWLHVLLRALGDIPELWGFSSLPDDRSDNNSDLLPPQDTKAFPATLAANSDPAGASQSQSSGPELRFIHYRGPGSRKSEASAQPPCQLSPNAHLPAATKPQPSPAFCTPTTPQGCGDKAGRLRQYRDENGSRHSLPATSISLRGSRARASFPSLQQKVSRLAEILQIERERITLMEHERDIAQGLAEFFYRGLFTEYSHAFMGSQMCQPYRAVLLRAPDAMIPMVVRICEHMERDLAILCELDKA